MSLDPPLLNLMVERLTEVNGDSVTVEEAEIFEAFRELAQHGFFVEPSSAVAYAGYKKQLEQEEASRTAHTVMILTGAGLKTALKPS
jgi:threonine synthase